MTFDPHCYLLLLIVFVITNEYFTLYQSLSKCILEISVCSIKFEAYKVYNIVSKAYLFMS